MKIFLRIWSHHGMGLSGTRREYLPNRIQVRDSSLQKKLVLFLVLLESYLVQTLTFALVGHALWLRWEVESRVSVWKRAT